MNASVRVLASLLATLSASNAFADVRPVPSENNNGPVVVPVPAPGHGPGRGPGYPFPGPGYPQPGPGYPQPGPGYPHPGPGYPHPGPGYPQPLPPVESFNCRDLRGGYDYVNISAAHRGRADYRVDMDSLGIQGNNLRAFASNRVNDTMLLQIQTQYGIAQFTLGYLNHPYGPTGVLSLGGAYQEFRCTRSLRPAPQPPNYPYPPSPYPPSPYPFPHR